MSQFIKVSDGEAVWWREGGRESERATGRRAGTETPEECKPFSGRRGYVSIVMK